MHMHTCALNPYTTHRSLKRIDWEQFPHGELDKCVVVHGGEMGLPRRQIHGGKAWQDVR